MLTFPQSLSSLERFGKLCGTVLYGLVSYGKVVRPWYDMVWYGMVYHTSGTVWFGLVWEGCPPLAMLASPPQCEAWGPLAMAPPRSILWGLQRLYVWFRTVWYGLLRFSTKWFALVRVCGINVVFCVLLCLETSFDARSDLTKRSMPASIKKYWRPLQFKKIDARSAF